MVTPRKRIDLPQVISFHWQKKRVSLSQLVKWFCEKLVSNVKHGNHKGFPPIPVSVNLSIRQFLQPTLLAKEIKQIPY